LKIPNFVYGWIGKWIANKLNLGENMDGTKKIWKSKTFWSDVVTIVLAIIGLVDTYFTGGKIAGNPAYQTLLAILGGVGIHGRATATQKIG